MFEIKISRHHDGRYIASIPDLHPSCTVLALTLQGAVRSAQSNAFSLLADFVRGNRKLPDAMKEWFNVVGADGSVCVGGCQHNEIPDVKLSHANINVIPPSPRTRALPPAPKYGTPEHTALVAALRASAMPNAAEIEPAPAAPETK